MRSPPDAALPPASLPVQLAPDVRVGEDGRLVTGGTPFRLMRLSARGAEVLGRWRARPAPVGDAPGARALARRLLDTGLLDAVPPPATALDDLSIVVPTRDRAPDLARCLTALGATAPGVPILVVDDGSRDPAAVAAAAAAHGAALVRHDVNRGPAAARTTGIARTTGTLVAFVDSDVVVGPDPAWLKQLVAHFADPRVGAAAPRVLGLDPPSGWIAGYESRRSSLDMGGRAGLAAPGRRLGHVPATTLVVRRAAAPEGGFDPALRVGEDVDFVWRMAAAGWLVRYEPRARVRHAHRVSPLAFAARRRDYARSVAPLALRHPRALPALRADWAMVAALALLASGRRRGALGFVSLRTVRLHRELRAHTEQPTRLAVRLAARDAIGSARGVSHALRRAWSPIVLLVAIRRPRAALLLVLAALSRLLDRDGPRRPGDVVLDGVDDLIAATGTWEGCVRHRTPRPLLPALRR
jgi:mycofactocin system glycosyltransferase